MGAGGFGTLAGHFTDRTVVTYDPRGAERSTKHDPAASDTRTARRRPASRHQALGGGPVDLFASSGGAVNALALVAAHPGDVRTLVAHEPPLASLSRTVRTPTPPPVRSTTTYQRSGWGAGMAHFIVIVSHRGPFPDGFAAQPAPDPAMFGMPDDDDGTRTDPMLGQHIIATTHYEPDFDALRAAPTQIVIAAGEGSEGELAQPRRRRGGGATRRQCVVFPGDHGGFFGGEYGQTGEPDAFAAKLREVLLSA